MGNRLMNGILKTLAPGAYYGVKAGKAAKSAVKYGQKVYEEVKDIPQKDAPAWDKTTFAVPTFFYQNQDRLKAAAKIVGEDIKDGIKESSSKAVDNYENASIFAKSTFGLTGICVNELNKLIAE